MTIVNNGGEALSAPPDQDGRLLGLDIGGAGLKSADGRGQARRLPFPLWKHPEKLEEGLRTLVGNGQPQQIAVTMTGELCDCFATRAEGVAAILDAVERAFADAQGLWIWQTDGRFTSPATARRQVWRTAASNWHALATFASRFASMGNGLLIDIGSTTTDLIPLREGVPAALGRTDPERLASGELVYVGVERTPLCAIVPTVEIRDTRYRTMAEWFATTRDVFLVLEDLAEAPSDTATADGRPATRRDAVERLARMIGADRSCFDAADALTFARQVESELVRQLRKAVTDVISRFDGGGVESVVIAGEGEFLARRLVASVPALRPARVISLAAKLGTEVSTAACAHAVAVLLAERPTGRQTASTV